MVKMAKLTPRQKPEKSAKFAKKSENARAEHDEITSKSAWGTVIRVCELTISVAAFLGFAPAPLRQGLRCEQNSNRKTNRITESQALTPRKGAIAYNCLILRLLKE
jgi:hypothetical protein